MKLRSFSVWYFLFQDVPKICDFSCPYRGIVMSDCPSIGYKPRRLILGQRIDMTMRNQNCPKLKKCVFHAGMTISKSKLYRKVSWFYSYMYLIWMIILQSLFSLKGHLRVLLFHGNNFLFLNTTLTYPLMDIFFSLKNGISVWLKNVNNYFFYYIY